MAAEFYLTFHNSSWIMKYKKMFDEYVMELKTFCKMDNKEYWFNENKTNNPYYDVRLIIKDEQSILMEIEFHPEIIENDLERLFSWIRNQTEMDIKDDGGEKSNW
jgi:hypothetical protein